ncbi:MAG: DUF5667 domain-containing protein [Candidatus Paceibacterota bacterium]|jgi:hypothetical protein
MENKKLQTGLEEIKKITMTAHEKKQVFDSVLSTPPERQEQLVRSPWSIYSFVSQIHKSNFAYYVIVPLLIIVTSGGIVFASEDSLPDSVLYPIKVSIIEPVRGALVFSQKSKAEYQSSLATERMIEAETLAKAGKLDKEKEKKLSTLLTNHTDALNKALAQVDQDKSGEQAEAIAINFQLEMNAHAEALDLIISEKEDVSDEQIIQTTEITETIETVEEVETVEDEDTKNTQTTDNIQDFDDEPDIPNLLDTSIATDVSTTTGILSAPSIPEGQNVQGLQISENARMSADKIKNVLKKNKKEIEFSPKTDESEIEAEIN